MKYREISSYASQDLRIILALIVAAILFGQPVFAEDDYSFDLGKFEDKPFEMGGYVELKYDHLDLNQDGLLYKLNFLQEPRSDINRVSGSTEINGMYKKGILIGQRIFGGDYLEDNKGMFWGIHETRPYMRCLQFYSDGLYTTGKIYECVAIQEEMLDLNPNDNQGIRDQLLLYLIQLGEVEKFQKYANMFPEDIGAYALFSACL